MRWPSQAQERPEARARGEGVTISGSSSPIGFVVVAADFLSGETGAAHGDVGLFLMFADGEALGRRVVQERGEFAFPEIGGAAVGEADVSIGGR